MKKIQMTVFLAGLCFLNFKSEAQPQPFLTNGLVSYYPLNGNANDAWGTNNGTPYGITYVPDRFGNPNGAASFAGNSSSYIDVTTTNLDFNLPFTVSVWVSYNNSGQGGPRVFSTSGYEVNLGEQSPTAQPDINFTGCCSLLSANSIQVDTWSHVVGVWTTNCMSIYVNGIASGSTPISSAPDFSRWPYARIGGNSGKLSDDHYGGLIDDLAIYNRALSPLEVAEIYQSSLLAGIMVVPGILVAGNSNQIYSIQYITNISSTNWMTLVSNILLQGNTYLYPDTNAAGQPQRFYRVVAQ